MQGKIKGLFKNIKNRQNIYIVEKRDNKGREKRIRMEGDEANRCP